MECRWRFHLGRAILQSEIVISIIMVQRLTAVGAIYKIVSCFSAKQVTAET